MALVTKRGGKLKGIVERIASLLSEESKKSVKTI